MASFIGLVLGVVIVVLIVVFAKIQNKKDAAKQASNPTIRISNSKINKIVVNGGEGDELPKEFYEAMGQLSQAFGGKSKEPEFVAVTCPNCGASCQIPKSGGKCEFCESFLNAE